MIHAKPLNPRDQAGEISSRFEGRKLFGAFIRRADNYAARNQLLDVELLFIRTDRSGEETPFNPRPTSSPNIR